MCNTLIHKQLIIFAIRGHLQLLEVNSRTFYDISAYKCIFTADIGQCLVGGFIVVIIARHVPWVNLLCFGVRKLF